jgi:hypothetical protein
LNKFGGKFIRTMPIYLHLTNFIVGKNAVSSKYLGGVDGFRRKYIIESAPYNQEDNHLFSITRMNVDEFDINDLVENGLSYDELSQNSTDFTIYNRQTGLLWQVDWLRENRIFAWHVECDVEEIKEVERISNLSMDELSKLDEKGLNPLKTITKSINSK